MGWKWNLAVYRVERLETDLQTEKLPGSEYVEGRTGGAKGAWRAQRESSREGYKKHSDVAVTTMQ